MVRLQFPSLMVFTLRCVHSLCRASGSGRNNAVPRAMTTLRRLNWTQRVHISWLVTGHGFLLGVPPVAGWFPPGYVEVAMENGHIEIVTFPIEKGGSFRSYVKLSEGSKGNPMKSIYKWVRTGGYPHVRKLPNVAIKAPIREMTH